MKSSIKLLFIILSIAIAVIFFHLFPIYLFKSSTYNSEFENLLHPFGFATVALAISFTFLSIYKTKTVKSRLLIYSAIIVLCTLFGITSEFVQSFCNRDSSFDDLSRDIAGSFAGVLIFLSFDKRLFVRIKILRILPLLLATITLTTVSLPFIHMTLLFSKRDKIYPELYSFDHDWETNFYLPQNASLEVVPNIEYWTQNKTKNSLRVTLNDGEYPGINFFDFFPDWSKADSFSLSIYSESDSTFSLFFRINDSKHINEFDDRFNTQLPIHAGENHFSFGIADIKSSLKNRTMDMDDISTIILFGDKSNSGKSFQLDSIRLNR